jgi:hypothetical protein
MKKSFVVDSWVRLAILQWLAGSLARFVGRVRQNWRVHQLNRSASPRSRTWGSAAAMRCVVMDAVVVQLAYLISGDYSAYFQKSEIFVDSLDDYRDRW